MVALQMARSRSVRRLALRIVLLGALVLLTSCAAGPNPAADTAEPAGFWLGLWHGLIMPVTFFVSLFTDTVSIYEVANRGNWYDVGFFIGAASSLGSAGRGSGGLKGRS